MFCWKCGKKLPDEAMFCTRCAAKQRRPETASTPPAPQPVLPGSQPAAAGLSHVGIAAIVAAAATFVFMLMPWIGVPVLRSVGQGTSAMGVTALSGDCTYTLWGLHDVLDNLRRVLQKDQYGAVFCVWVVFMVGWACSLVALVIGAVRAISGKKPLDILFGASIAAAVVAIAWALVIIVLNGTISGELSRATNGSAAVKVFEVPMAVYLTAACGAVAAALCRTERVKRAAM